MRKINQAPGVGPDSRTEFMLVSCPGCGRENDASQNFCGICGVPLRRSEQSSTPPSSFSEQRPEGFSFLGLNDSPESPDFLLTEVKGGGAGRTLVVLLLFLVVGASFMWLWRHEAARRATWLEERLRSVISHPSNALPESSDSVSNPEDASTPSNQIEDSGERTAPNDSQNADAQAQSNAGEPPIEESDVTSHRSSQNNNPGTMQHESPARQPDQSNSEPDTLAAEGQKYLYTGRGPQDCRRAQQTLMSAAEQSSSRAEALLGTMYATGHCVARDLPTAYRWFSRAQVSDPRNARIREDWDLVWKEMTLEQRKSAQIR